MLSVPFERFMTFRRGLDLNEPLFSPGHVDSSRESA